MRADTEPARRPIGEFLVERGFVTPAQLTQALSEQRRSGKRLGEILIEHGAITRMALASVLSEQWEEAGRHLRAVAPVRLAGDNEAPAPAGSLELPASLAALHAAVSRLEELAAGPAHDDDAAAEATPAGREALDEITSELASLRTELSGLRASLMGRSDGAVALERLEGRLEELAERGREHGAELAAAAPAVAARIGELEELLAEVVASGDNHLAQRLADVHGELQAGAASLARLEHLVAETAASLAGRLDELERDRGTSGDEEAHAAELASRDALIAELSAQVEALRAEAAREDGAPPPEEPTSFLALVPSPAGYELLALEGLLPAVGSRLDVGGGDTPPVVTRIGPSPLPGDRRRCAYLTIEGGSLSD